VLLYASDIGLNLLMDHAYFFKSTSVFVQFYAVDILAINAGDVVRFLVHYVAPWCILLSPWFMMKAIREISIRATRKSSRSVMTGAMPYLTRVMEAIVVVARLSEVELRLIY
jgi:hypothetical protein